MGIRMLLYGNAAVVGLTAVAAGIAQAKPATWLIVSLVILAIVAAFILDMITLARERKRYERLTWSRCRRCGIGRLKPHRTFMDEDAFVCDQCGSFYLPEER